MDLIPRLSRTDFFLRRGFSAQMTPDYYGRALCLSNLFEKAQDRGATGLIISSGCCIPPLLSPPARPPCDTFPYPAFLLFILAPSHLPARQGQVPEAHGGASPCRRAATTQQRESPKGGERGRDNSNSNYWAMFLTRR